MSRRDAVLLDTHVLLWWQAESDRLSRTAAAAISGATNVLVSPISCWEVSMLMAKGRVALDRPVTTWVIDLLGEGGPAEVADLTPTVAAAAGQLSDLQGDPADRLIYATARTLGVPLVTKDQRLTDAAASDEAVAVVW